MREILCVARIFLKLEMKIENLCKTLKIYVICSSKRMVIYITYLQNENLVI